MQALILAGGQGTRLRPHTEALPKPLLPLGASTILDRQLSSLQAAGITRITIITGYFSHKIREHLDNRYRDLDIRFIHNTEFEHSRPAYAIIQAIPHLRGDDCLYLNGDVLYDQAILHEILKASQASVTAIQNTPWDEEQVKVILANGSLIRHISKNIPLEESQGEFIGITKLSNQLIDTLHQIATKESSEAFRYAFAIDFLNHAINTYVAEIHAIDVSHLSAIEIDTPRDYARAQAIAHLFSEAV